MEKIFVTKSVVLSIFIISLCLRLSMWIQRENGIDLFSLPSYKNHSESNNASIHAMFSFENITYDQIPYKIFRKWNKPFPCFVPIEEKEVDEKARDGKFNGLLYIKVPKTGSSTLAGINLRIAHRHVPSNMNVKRCSCTYGHHKAERLNLPHRSKNTTFLWTVVRQPTSQIISRFFHFRVGRKKVLPNLINFKSFVKTKDVGEDAQARYVSPRILTLNDTKTEERRIETTQEIINHYDFMGITERLDESLVALRWTLGLNAGDILHVSSKVNGGYDDGRYNRTCVKIPPPMLSEEMKTYISSQEFKDELMLSEKLYKAVNKSLDLTIQNIGQEVFAKALEEHRNSMVLVNQICAPTTIFPCSKDGKIQFSLSKNSCYNSDNGCGYHCLDDNFLNETLNTAFSL